MIPSDLTKDVFDQRIHARVSGHSPKRGTKSKDVNKRDQVFFRQPSAGSQNFCSGEVQSQIRFKEANTVKLRFR